jgi:hypothetical protein
MMLLQMLDVIGISAILISLCRKKNGASRPTKWTDLFFGREKKDNWRRPRPEEIVRMMMDHEDVDAPGARTVQNETGVAYSAADDSAAPRAKKPEATGEMTGREGDLDVKNRDAPGPPAPSRAFRVQSGRTTRARG